MACIRPHIDESIDLWFQMEQTRRAMDALRHHSDEQPKGESAMDIDLDGLRNTRKYKYAYLLRDVFEVFTRDIDDKGNPVSEWELYDVRVNYPDAIKEGLEVVLNAEGKKEFQIRDLKTEEVIWI